MKNYYLPLLLACLCSKAVAGDVVAILNIDSVGPEKVAEAKSMSGVDWWIEVGSRLVVRGDEAFVEKWRAVPVLSVHAAVEPEELLLWTQMHCSADHDHDVLTKTVTDPFLAVPGASISLRGAKSVLPQQQPLMANQVVLAQAANLPVHAKAASYTNLVSGIQADRYAASLAALSAYDRQEQDGLFAAIEVIENELAPLPLEVRREQWGLLPSRAPNLIAIQRGSTNPEDVVVIGAHLDSRNAFRNSEPSPGAEDNGSGSAAVLEIARTLSSANPESTIIYAWFTGEEQGLLGSTDWIAQQQAAGTQIRAMLNMDMISYTSVPDQRAAIISTTFATDLLDDLAAAGLQHTELDLLLRYNSCCTDHVPFLEAGIPAVATIQADRTSYPHYHQSTDTVDHLTPDLGVQIARMNAALLANLAGIAPEGDASFDVDGGISGYWYDPDQSGQGFQVEVLENGDAVVTWYTFSDSGEQLWLIGSGSVDGDTVQVDFVAPSGGLFPPNFDPATIQLTAWGSATFQFAACSEGSVSWDPVSDATAAGSMPLARLTQPGGLVCDNP